jgi:non-ribosomal peptide synthetase component E (peptide arylation enzyme)
MAITRADTRLSDAVIEQYVSAGYWNVPTFPELLERNARSYPDEIAFIDDYRQISWAELWDSSRRFATQLIKLGVGRNDVVAVQLPNRIEFVIAMAGISQAGAIICPYVVSLRHSEAKFVLSFSMAVVAIVPHPKPGQFDLLAMTEKLQPELPHLKHIVVVGGGTSGSSHEFETLLQNVSAIDEDALCERAPGPHDINRILFTSGSTGDPKGVLHTYASTIFSNIRQNEHMDVTRDSALLLFIPVTLNWGMFQILQAALAPCRLVFQEEFSPGRVLTAIETHRITHFGTPPTGLIALLADPSVKQRDLTSLRLAVTSGTSCPVDLLVQTRAVLGCSVMEGYGMTECGWVCAAGRDDIPEESVGTVGFPFPWMLLHICDENGKEVSPGTPGEITMDGPCICVGYYRNPQRNKESWTADGRFRSGDLGVIEPSGRLRMVGRTKDIIKHGGLIIYPRELEELIFTHPKVRQVAVVGVPDQYFGENICACIIPKPGESIELEEILVFLKNRVATYKLPQQLEILNAFPVTATGKVQKHALQKQLLERTKLDQRKATAVAEHLN